MARMMKSYNEFIRNTWLPDKGSLHEDFEIENDIDDFDDPSVTSLSMLLEDDNFISGYENIKPKHVPNNFEEPKVNMHNATFKMQTSKKDNYTIRTFDKPANKKEESGDYLGPVGLIILWGIIITSLIVLGYLYFG